MTVTQRQQLAQLKEQIKVLLHYIRTLEDTAVALGKENRRLNDENFELQFGYTPGESIARGC
jgi:hypothetical protein